jgi:putative SOS response-associated peptidase YedK
MCYHKQDIALESELIKRYNAGIDFPYSPVFYENGFDHLPTALLTGAPPGRFQSLRWGLIPWWVKSHAEAMAMRARTLNCISEEAFDKPAFRDSIREKRCLVPCTGFFEWRWFNNGKTKYPYFIRLKGEKIFSLAGIWSTWTDRGTGEELATYAVLTTRANPLMERVHNSKKRMPVILPREYEPDWLNPNLTKEDILALCAPFATEAMEAYTISKAITDRRIENKNIPAITDPFDYPELALLDA